MADKHFHLNDGEIVKMYRHIPYQDVDESHEICGYLKTCSNENGVDLCKIDGTVEWCGVDSRLVAVLADMFGVSRI
jgi:hypothetical protein